MPSLPSRLPGKLRTRQNYTVARQSAAGLLGAKFKPMYHTSVLRARGCGLERGKAVDRRCVSYAPACDESGREHPAGMLGPGPRIRRCDLLQTAR